MKRTIIILLAALILSTTSTLIALAADQAKTIAITQIVDHPSLNEAKKGIIQALKDAGYMEGKNIKIIDENAQGNISIAVQIAEKLVSMKPDIIMPISTVSAQTILTKAKAYGIPVVFSSVTDAAKAGLSNNNIITGATDFPPMKEGIAMIKELVLGITKLGIIYNPSESNSVKSVEIIKKMVEGIEIIEATATSSNNVVEAMNSLVGKVDAIYLPSDNTVWSSMRALTKVANTHKIPVFSSDPDSVKQGVLAAIGYSQYEVGYKAGEMAASILNGSKTVSDIKISTPEKYMISVNKKSLERLGIRLPNQILGQKITIIDGDIK